MVQWLGVFEPQPGNPSRTVNELDMRPGDVALEGVGQFRAFFVHQKLLQRRGGGRLRLGARCPGRQPAHQQEPILVGAFQIRGEQFNLRLKDERRPEIRRPADAFAKEFRRCDSHDGERGAVEISNFPDDSRIAM